MTTSETISIHLYRFINNSTPDEFLTLEVDPSKVSFNDIKNNLKNNIDGVSYFDKNKDLRISYMSKNREGETIWVEPSGNTKLGYIQNENGIINKYLVVYKLGNGGRKTKNRKLKKQMRKTKNRKFKRQVK